MYFPSFVHDLDFIYCDWNFGESLFGNVYAWNYEPESKLKSKENYSPYYTFSFFLLLNELIYKFAHI